MGNSLAHGHRQKTQSAPFESTLGKDDIEHEKKQGGARIYQLQVHLKKTF
jgi:hypothetical protein